MILPEARVAVRDDRFPYSCRNGFPTQRAVIIRAC